MCDIGSRSLKSRPSGLVFVRLSRTCSTAAKGTPETLAVASLDAEDFIENPTVETYLGLKKSAKKARVWSEIEKGTMRSLEKVVLPYSGGAWPLKQTGLKSHPYSRKKDFPLTHTLIDIAIEEKRPDDVIRWYDKRKQESHGRGSSGSWEDEIAKAIVSKYPERALRSGKG
jgi:uncharacterized Zn finger protein